MSFLSRHSSQLFAISLLTFAGWLGACGVDGNGDPGTDADPGPKLFPGPCQINTDLGIDNTIDRRDTRTYSGDALIRVEQDNNVDGKLDYIQTRMYDGEARLFLLDEDTNGDTVIDLHRRYTYGPGGLLEKIEFDAGNDNSFERVQTHVYDSGKRLVSLDDDTNLDGAPESRYLYKYNVADQLTRIERDDAPIDGVFAYREDRTYDDGLLSSQVIDGNGDGVFEARVEYIRDGLGNVLQVDRHTNANVDEIADDREHWSYDCFSAQ